MTGVRGATAAGLLTLVAAAACGRDPDPGDDVAVPPMPADFAVAIGGGSGLAGSWRLISVGADGIVRAVNYGPGEGGFSFGRLSEHRRRAIWRELHARGFFAMSNEPGEMSACIMVTANGRVRWIAHEAGSQPEGFEPLLHFVADRLTRPSTDE